MEIRERSVHFTVNSTYLPLSLQASFCTAEFHMPRLASELPDSAHDVRHLLFIEAITVTERMLVTLYIVVVIVVIVNIIIITIIIT